MRSAAALIGFGLLMGGCRSELLGLPGDAAVAPSDDEYEAHVLPTKLGQLGIFKRSQARQLCAWIVLAQGTSSIYMITTPPGWVTERASINDSAADCFTLEPFGPTFWPANAGTGTVIFSAPAGQLPCTLSVHATLAADKTANGVPRPPEVAPQERFDADGLIVAGACTR